MRRSLLLTVLLASVALTSGCVYRMAVQQGNFLDPKQVSQLQTGMTRSQVRFLLGTPMLPDAFDNDRWDYVYFLKTGRRGNLDERRLTVWFEDDKVARFENVGTPISPPADPAAAPAAAPNTGASATPAATPAPAPAAPSP